MAESYDLGTAAWPPETALETRYFLGWSGSRRHEPRVTCCLTPHAVRASYWGYCGTRGMLQWLKLILPGMAVRPQSSSADQTTDSLRCSLHFQGPFVNAGGAGSILQEPYTLTIAWLPALGNSGCAD